jgi:hypothetical protein
VRQNGGMNEMLCFRIERGPTQQASKVAEEIGATPEEIAADNLGKRFDCGLSLADAGRPRRRQNVFSRSSPFRVAGPDE